MIQIVRHIQPKMILEAFYITIPTYAKRLLLRFHTVQLRVFKITKQFYHGNNIVH